jgi:hypothetical protein
MFKRSILFVLMWMSPMAAVAQDLSSMYSTSVFQQSVIQMGSPTLEPGQRSIVGSPDNTQGWSSSTSAAFKTPASGDTNTTNAAKLQFRRNARTSKRVQQQMVDALSSSNPAIRPGLEDMFSSGYLMRGFENVLDQRGYSTTNLADVAAVYFVFAWELVNNRNSGQKPIGQQAVRYQLQQALIADPMVTAMPNAQKQELADRLAYSIMLYALVHQSLKSQNNPDQIKALGNSLRKSVLDDVGIDLRQLELTDAGLIMR